MSEQWANFEAPFSCGDDVWYLEQKFHNNLGKQKFKKLISQFEFYAHVIMG